MNGVEKLLDNGHAVVLFRGGLGSYCAAAISKDDKERFPVDELLKSIEEWDAMDRRVTDAWHAEETLHNLSEKVLGTGEYGEWPDSIDDITGGEADDGE